MSYEKLLAFRKGEKKPIYATLKSSTGNQVVLNPKFYLLDSLKNVVLNGVTGGISGSPGAIVKVYYTLDSAALNESSWYYGYFTESDVPADSIQRNLQPSFAIWIAPIVEATCIVGTDIGTVRLYIADTNVDNVVFSDPEIQEFINLTSGKLTLSASLALGSQATDRAKLALSINTGGWGTSQQAVYNALVERSEYYRRISPSKMLVPQTDQIFSMGSLTMGTSGSLDVW